MATVDNIRHNDDNMYTNLFFKWQTELDKASNDYKVKQVFSSTNIINNFHSYPRFWLGFSFDVGALHFITKDGWRHNRL